MSLWTPRPSPQLGVILTPITDCNVTVKQHNTWYGLRAGFLNAVQGIEHRRGNEISLHAVSHYTPQEVNTIIRITRHLSSRGGVQTKIPFLHERRLKVQYAPDLGQKTKLWRRRSVTKQGCLNTDHRQTPAHPITTAPGHKTIKYNPRGK